MTHTMQMQKVKIKGHLVQKLEWKQKDGQTDGRTDGGDSITSRANAVDKRGVLLGIESDLCHQAHFPAKPPTKLKS